MTTLLDYAVRSLPKQPQMYVNINCLYSCISEKFNNNKEIFTLLEIFKQINPIVVEDRLLKVWEYH